MQADIFIISNGPGELSAWVRPMVGQLRQEFPDARLTLALVPCPYASGKEAETARAWGEDLAIWSPKETLSRLFSSLKPQAGAVLFMGGDQFYGLWLARKTHLPLFTYTEGFARWKNQTTRFLLKDEATLEGLGRRGFPLEKCQVVGDLMVDAAHRRLGMDLKAQWGLMGRPVVSLLPGSKPFKVRYMTPMFLKAADLIAQECPEAAFVIHRSPFTGYEALEEALADSRFREVTGGTTGRLEREAETSWVVTEAGTRIRVAEPHLQYDAMAVADLALAVPGTNTAELAILGVPMVVALPLNKPEVIPLDGLIGRVGEIPLLGAALKRALIPAMARKFPHVALPNQKAGRRITPELVGVLEPQDIAREALTLLREASYRAQVGLELQQAMGNPGAAKTIAAVLQQCLPPHDAERPNT